VRLDDGPKGGKGHPGREAAAGQTPGIAAPETIAAKRPFASCGKLTETFYEGPPRREGHATRFRNVRRTEGSNEIHPSP
jgi:hypothetical protein